MLEVKANKLEEQVRDLTVSHLYLLQQLFQKRSFIDNHLELVNEL